MPLVIAAVGRLRRGALSDLYHDYAGRITGAPFTKLELREIAEAGGANLQTRRAKESASLLERSSDLDRRVVLDERGENLTSQELAETLQNWIEAGEARIGFLIGSDAGLSSALREGADLALALGAQTWPHQLIRAMLAEQLYRAQAILNRHPYHRAD